jgi:hypothetical protein
MRQRLLMFFKPNPIAQINRAAARRAVPEMFGLRTLCHRWLPIGGEKAARKLIQIANSVDAVQDGRIYIELINAPFLYEKASPAEYKAGLELAIARGWLVLHESVTYVKFTQAGAELFA